LAKKLRSHNFSGRGARNIYPWEEWFDGNIWELTHGEDFHGEAKSFRSNLHTAAAKYGGKVRTNVRDNGNIVFQFYVEDGN